MTLNDFELHLMTFNERDIWKNQTDRPSDGVTDIAKPREACASKNIPQDYLTVCPQSSAEVARSFEDLGFGRYFEAIRG